MPDPNEQLPPYMRDSQPAPPTQQPAPSAPAQPTQGQQALPAYMQATTGADTQTAAEALDKLSRSGPIDKLADIAGEIAPYIMPEEGFAGAAAGEAASGLAKIIGEALQNPVTRNAVIGAATGETGAISDAVQGKDAHWLADPVVGAVGGAALGKAAKGVHNLLSRAGTAAPEIQAAESLGAEYNVPVYTTDVVKPETSIGKYARRFVEQIPIIGTASQRRGQQEAREHLAATVRDKFAKTGYSAQALVDDVLGTHTEVKSGANEKYGEIVDGMKGAPIASKKTLSAINTHIEKLTKTPSGVPRQNVDTSTVNTLQTIANDIKADPSFENLQGIRRSFRENVRGDRVVWPDSHQRMSNKIYSAMSKDLKDGVGGTLGQAGLMKWNVANKKLALEAELVHKSALKQVFNRGELTPETAEQLLKSTKESDQRQLYNSLSDKGRAVAMSGLISKIVEKATSNEGALNPTGLLNGLEKQKKALAIFGSKGDRDYLEGVTQILNVTRRAQEAAAAPETGAKFVPFAGLVHPGALIPSIAGGILGRLYESKATRNLIMKLGKTSVGSSRFANLMTQINRRVGVSEPSGQPAPTVQSAQAPEQSAIDWAQESGAPPTLTQATAASPQAPAEITRGMRNNNPLNIRSSTHNMWRGKAGDADGFVQFSSPEMGIRAAARTLKSYRKKGLTTLTGIINRFAPGSENNTESYIHSIEQMIGVNRNVPLKSADYPRLIKAMGMIESRMNLDENVIKNLWNKS